MRRGPFPMASVTVFLLFSLFITPAAQQRSSNISIGSSLTPTGANSSWLSPSGLYAFGFYQQGNGYAVGIFLAGIPQKTVVWTAKRDDPPVSSNYSLHFTSDGMLTLKSAQGQHISIIATSQSASSAAMSDSGNFVLYNSEDHKIWQSFENPTDTLLPTQHLEAEQQLFSSVSELDHSTGIFRLKMQQDGNLVQYPVQTPDTAPYAYWSSGTFENGGNNTLNFDNDGRLYLLNSKGLNIMTISLGGNPTKETTYLMKLDVDGILRMYSYNLKQNGNWSILWSSTNDPCDPKGLCGINSYCVINDQEATCRCLPGFAIVNQGNWTSGCERNFSAESCKQNISYSIEELPNTVWDDNSYSVLSMSLQECRKACLEDCNCEAAFFDERLCRKQELPLRFGRKNSKGSNSALIKVGTYASTTNRIEAAENKNKLRKDILAISISFGTFAFVMLAVFGIVIWRHHAWTDKRISNNDHINLSDEVGPRAFTYAELEEVTGGFKEEIGRGAFGRVYKGLIFRSQKVVAVKKLEMVLAEGEKEFQTEVKVIGRTHHRNLVRLLGYCLDGPNRLLVYEYMSNGSLADVLFSPENRPCFTERMEISRSIARGILYLHEQCDTRIIHCDIKPQNILMDENMCPKISDFGLAKLLREDQSKTNTGVRGTRGYVAPEWHRKMPVTVKADVYSFGIVLLVIICCRKAVDQSLPDEEIVLIEWAYSCFVSGNIDKLQSEEDKDGGQFESMVKVGLWCTQDEPSRRPSMQKVLLMLEGTAEIPAPPSPMSFLSTM